MTTGQAPKPKIYLEKRRGRQVTVISGLHTYGEQRLTAISKELKTLLGAGGTVKNGVIEVQGDKVKQVQEWFKKGLRF
jgi:translation initiation factor 1